MYYELYIDILFMVNFMMDYLVLSLVKVTTKSVTSRLRLVIASMIGALLTCATYILPLPYVGMRFVLFHGVINILMIIIGFRIRDRMQFAKCLIFLYIGAFLLGGVFQYMQQYMKVGSLFFLLAMVSYGVVQGIWKFLCYFQKENGKWYDADVYMNENHIRVKALLDTGNGLCDPSTGEAVHVIQKDSIVSILPELNYENIRLIPYHSIGSEGTMQAIQAQRIHLQGEREMWIEGPVLALCEQKISSNQSYQMILNPGIL